MPATTAIATTVPRLATLLVDGFYCKQVKILGFLGATKPSYKRVCPSVHPPVCLLRLLIYPLIAVFGSTLCRVFGLVFAYSLYKLQASPCTYESRGDIKKGSIEMLIKHCKIQSGRHLGGFPLFACNRLALQRGEFVCG